MKLKQSHVWMISGAMLLLAALLLVMYNMAENRRGQAASEKILTELKAAMPETQPAPIMPEFPAENDLFSEYETESDSIPEEVLIEADGKMYLGIITIPSLGIELPVLSEWSYPNLKLSPCRYKGSVPGGDLIIAAHNYRSHFGRIQDLNSGDLLILTDGSGYVHTYTVLQSEMVAGRDIEAMEFGSAELWDLTLFTCTLSGQSRVTVRAVEN